jgi:hypothetical protein
VVSKIATSTVKTTRSNTATPAPNTMPVRRCAGASTTGHRDDNGVVARKNDVEPDDLADLDQCAAEIVHAALVESVPDPT